MCRQLKWSPFPGGCYEVAARRGVSSPVLTAPVSAVPALCATVRARPGPFCTVKTASNGVFDGTELAGTRSVGRNSADGRGEDRVSFWTFNAGWRRFHHGVLTELRVKSTGYLAVQAWA